MFPQRYNKLNELVFSLLQEFLSLLHGLRGENQGIIVSSMIPYYEALTYSRLVQGGVSIDFARSPEWRAQAEDKHEKAKRRFAETHTRLYSVLMDIGYREPHKEDSIYYFLNHMDRIKECIERLCGFSVSEYAPEEKKQS